MTDLLNRLAAECGLHPRIVEKIARSAPGRYKTYEIPKRHGGTRPIAQPALEVKVLQRALIKILLAGLPVHPAATAYIPGMSLSANVRPHQDAGPILKLDLEGFFPSLIKRDWEEYCRVHDLLERDDVELTSSLLFHRPRGHTMMRLAIGAPSSPMLSNILMFDFDDAISAAVASDHVTYTRYSDDLTFSAKRTGYLNQVVKNVYAVIKATKSPSLWVNKDKTTFVTKKYRRTVTGLTISNDARITLGRRRKKLIRAALNRALKHELSQPQLQQLSGWLAFAHSTEPTFLDVMRRVYGNALIQSVSRTVIIGQRRDSTAPLFPPPTDAGRRGESRSPD